MNRRYVTDNTWQVPVVNPVEVQVPYDVDAYAAMVAQETMMSGQRGRDMPRVLSATMRRAERGLSGPIRLCR